MRLAPLLLLTTLMVQTASGLPPERTEARSIESWFAGKTREEVVQLLGKPSKTKVRKNTTVLVYKPDTRGIAFFPSDTPNPHAFLAEGETGSGPVDALLDVLVNPDPALEYTEQDHAVTVGTKGPVRRIELRLDHDDRVETVRIKWRKHATRPEDRVHE